jgi:hypothetical protein
MSRLKLVLGKYPVKKLERKFGGLVFWLDLGGPQMQIRLNNDADVREGDLLTIYTEVLNASPPHSSNGPSRQR